MEKQLELGFRKTATGIVDLVAIERDARRLRAIYIADLARRVRNRIAGWARRPSPSLPRDVRPSPG